MITEAKIFCVPGDRLCISDDNNLAGSGTYVYRNYIYAANAGVVQVKSDENVDSIDQLPTHKHRTISVIHDIKVGINRTPNVGVIVTCKVLSINSSMVKCQIYCIEDRILKLPFKGVLRKEDIAADNKDIIEVHKCFRPRDVILARVVGLSDQGYMLTTAEDELGVVTGFSEARQIMIPISWTEMICPLTYIKEERKIAQILTPHTISSQSTQSSHGSTQISSSDKTITLSDSSQTHFQRSV